MTTLQIINLAIMLAFFLCYSYQFFYIPVAWFKKDAPHREPSPHRIAVLIAARNEQAVIGNLIDSIKRAGPIPTDLVDIFVVADNCTDDTARVAARRRGHRLLSASTPRSVGKGYALNYLLHRIERGLFAGAPTTAIFVFDADNVLDPELHRRDEQDLLPGLRHRHQLPQLQELRRQLDLRRLRPVVPAGVAVTSTTPASTCWAPAAPSPARASCSRQTGAGRLTAAGTSTCSPRTSSSPSHNVVRGHKIGYCHDAVLYDEQPTTFRQSWRQRLRWARGYLQVFGKYGVRLLRGIFRGSFSCFDMTMNIMPAAVAVRRVSIRGESGRCRVV